MPERMAWAAGLADGEGSIFARILEGSKVEFHFCVTNTDYEALEEFRQIVGCGGIYRLAKTKLGRQAWMWSANGKVAQTAAAVLRPWLRIKAKQADVLLAVPIRLRGGLPRLTSFEIIGRAVALAELKRLNAGR